MVLVASCDRGLYSPHVGPKQQRRVVVRSEFLLCPYTRVRPGSRPDVSGYRARTAVQRENIIGDAQSLNVTSLRALTDSGDISLTAGLR